MQQRAWLLAILQCLLPVATLRPIAGQPLSWLGPLEPGHRVRVWHGDRCCRSPQTGTLMSISGDSVILRASDAAPPQALARASVRFLERGFPDGTYALRL